MPKLPEKTQLNNLFVPLYFFLVSLLLIYHFGQFPLKRYPNYDYSWGDAILYSHYYDLKKSILNFTFPQINLFSSFGQEKIAELASYINPFSFINILLIFFNPANFMMVKMILNLFLLGMGTFKLLEHNSVGRKKSIMCSTYAMTIPVFWSMFFLRSTISLICSIPLFIYLLEKTKMRSEKRIYLLLFFLINYVSIDLISTALVFLVFVSYILAVLFSEHRQRITMSLLTLPLFSTTTFTIPFFEFFITNFQEDQSIRDHNISIVQYLRFLVFNGAHSFLYPIEGSAIQLFLPLFFYILFFSYLYKLRKLKTASISIYIYFILFFVFLPIFAYMLPAELNILPSYFRYQLMAIPIMVFIISIIILNSKIFNIQIISLMLLFCVLIECFLFIFKPVEYFFGKDFSELLTNQSIQFPDLKSSLIFPFFFLHSNPWIFFIIVNFLVVILFFYSENTKNHYLVTFFWMLICIGVIYTSFSAHIELRRYSGISHQTSSSDYRIENYDLRISKWINNFNLNDLNFRTLPTAKRYGIGQNYGRNLKLLLDTELNNIYGISVLFSYREAESMYNSKWYSSLSCFNCNTANIDSSYYPPLVSQVESNLDWLKKTSIKFVIAADQRIENRFFRLLDTYNYSGGISGYDHTENGNVYLYEFIDAVPMVTAQTGTGSIKSMALNRLILNIPDQDDLIQLKLRYSKYFKGFSDGKRIKIDKSNDGFIQFSSENLGTEVIIIYNNPYFVMGLLISLFFLCWIMIRK